MMSPWQPDVSVTSPLGPTLKLAMMTSPGASSSFGPTECSFGKGEARDVATKVADRA